MTTEDMLRGAATSPAFKAAFNMVVQTAASFAITARGWDTDWSVAALCTVIPALAPNGTPETSLVQVTTMPGPGPCAWASSGMKITNNIARGGIIEMSDFNFQTMRPGCQT